MCGRFTLTADLDFLIERFQIAYDIMFDYQRRFNIAPSQNVLAVVRGTKGNKIGQLKWGLVPPWAEDPKIGYKMINARSETAANKASFRQSLQSQRCLILADSFYEWKQEGSTKQPYRIFLKERPIFAFAGLWSIWKKDGTTLPTCTILTTGTNSIMSEIHHRMPVILEEEEEAFWLDSSNQDPSLFTSIFEPYPDGKMALYPVSAKVNSPKVDGPELIERLGKHKGNPCIMQELHKKACKKNRAAH